MVMELDKVYLGDCLQLLKDMPDKSVDLVVTDPPYEIDPKGAGFHKHRDYVKVLEQQGLTKGFSIEILQELERVQKATNIYLFCNKNQLRMYFDFYAEKNCDLLVWHKLNPIPVINNNYLPCLEYIFFARDKGVRLGGDYSTLSKVFTTNVNKKDLNLWGHPTIKPLPIIKTLISNSSIEGGIVLDPFCGSGTTCVAAKQLGRHYIGMEIDKKYHSIAEKRIKAETAQLELF